MLFRPIARHIFQQPQISSPGPRAKPTQYVRPPANDKDNNREPVDIPIDLTVSSMCDPFARAVGYVACSFTRKPAHARTNWPRNKAGGIDIKTPVVSRCSHALYSVRQDASSQMDTSY